MKDFAQYAINLARDRGASYADVRIEKSDGQAFLLKNGSPELGGISSHEGIGLRMLIKGKLVFGATGTLSKKGIKALVFRSAKAASATAKVSPSKNNFASAKTVRTTQVIKAKKPFSSIGPEGYLAYLKNLDALAASCRTRFFSLGVQDTKKCFVNTEGSVITTHIPSAALFAVCGIVKGKKSMQRMWQKGGNGGFEQVRHWDLEGDISQEIPALKKNLKEARLAPKGKLDVVAAPEVTGILVHESGGHPYEADRILGREAAQAGESFISLAMKGHRLASPNVSVVDDPLLKGGAGSYLHDDEGIPAKKKFLLKKGLVNDFLHSRETAAECKTHPNGSARACAYNREPIPRMSNTYMLPGSHNQDELINGIKKGVFIKNFMEWNIDDRRMNQKYVGNESYLIENGRLTNPVLHPVIELSTPTLYGAIDALARDVQHFYGTCGKGEPMQGIPVTLGGPSIRLRNIILGGSHAR
ncbi:MAG: TldD/PmbA family protein [Nanoarchaeota archaeon]